MKKRNGCQKRADKEFNMHKYVQRHIALRVYYDGEPYNGLAIQAPSNNMTVTTVEGCLFDALKRLALVESIEDMNYSRCGRTDKGVSAACNILALKVRSNEGHKEKKDEIKYAFILNKVLPPSIRVLAWSPVLPTFNARYDCLSRTYRYYFLSSEHIDINVMKEAALLFVGSHSFHNFCKLDASCVQNFIHTIDSFTVNKCDSRNGGVDCDAWYMEITARSFLYNQVRCMVAVLMLVARGEEDMDVITHMLDVDKVPRKPVYDIAPPEPLVLYDCRFPDGIFEWRESPNHIWEVMKERDIARLKDMRCSDIISQHVGSDAFIREKCESRKHTPLLRRPTCDSYFDKVELLKIKHRV